MTDPGGPLHGTVVLDLSRALAGPHAAMLLGDLGARVIKVERPGAGDDSRHWGPPFVGPQEEAVSTYFLSCNRNKESIELDLKSDEGRRLLTRLLRAADVMVENFRPGVLERLGFGPERMHEINPRLVICSITGFGGDGPEGGRAGYDQIAQGEAGLMSLTGPGPGAPTKVGVPIGDLLAGLHGAYGVLGALYERQHTGRGTVVRTSLLSSIVGAHAFQGTRWTVAGEVPEPSGNHHPSIAPYGLYRCGDGMVQIAVASERQWERFAALVGIDPCDARFAGNAERVARRVELDAEIDRVLATADRATWMERITRVGVPCGAIRTLEEVYGWDQTHSQGLVLTVEHSLLGEIALPGPAVRFDAGGRTRHLAPPRLGEHNAEVVAWLDSLDGEGGTPRPG